MIFVKFTTICTNLAGKLILRCSEANHYPLWVLVLLLLDVSLHLLWVEALEAVGLDLEAIVEVSEVVDVVVDSL